MTNPDPKQPTTLWTFPHITKLAYEALAETSLLSQDEWSVTVNKALQLEIDVTNAHRKGGAFIILTSEDDEPTEAVYIETGPVRVSLKVKLTPSSLVALLDCTPLEDAETDKFSSVLNRALQRWRDVIVAQVNGGCAFLQSSLDEPFVGIEYL